MFTHSITNVQTVVTPTTTSATSLQVVVPSVEGGDYTVRVRLDPEGESNGLELTLQTNFVPMTYQSSVNGGSIVLTGKGLPTSWPASGWSLGLSTSGKSLEIDVIDAQAERLELKVPAGVDGQTYSVSLTNPFDDANTATITQSTAKTPTLTLTTSSPVSVGSHQLVLTIDTLTSETPSKLYVNNILNPDNLQEITFTRATNTLTSDSTALGSGQYTVSVWYSTLGWASVSGSLEVTAPSFSASATSVSYAGGLLTVSSD